MTPRFVTLALALIVAAPPLDPWFDEVMLRNVLGQQPLLVVLGFLTGWRRDATFSSSRARSRALAALFNLTATLIFAMLPRTVDLTVSSGLADQVLHACLFVGGAALGRSFPDLGFAARGAAGILGVSMLFALGTYYASSEILSCSVYTLELQQEVGRRMLVVATSVLVLLLVALGRTLARAHRQAPTEARADPGARSAH